MPHRHGKDADYICGRCKMMVLAHIPHECDPSICVKCSGEGKVFSGRRQGIFVGLIPCPDCKGTGKTIFREEEGVT